MGKRNHLARRAAIIEPLEIRRLLAVAADAYEENDTFLTAAPIADGAQTIDDLTMWPAGDDDYFRFFAEAPGRRRVQTFSVLAQMNLSVYAPDGSVIAQASGTDPQVIVDLPAPGFYTIHVDETSAVQVGYKLVIEEPILPPPSIGSDAYEENDTFLTAAPIADGPQVIDALTMYPAGDDDYFRFFAAAPATRTVQTFSVLAQMTLWVLAPDGSVLAQASGTDPAVTIDLPAAGFYTIHVDEAGLQQVEYKLVITEPSAPPPPPLELGSVQLSSASYAVDEDAGSATITLVRDSAAGSASVNLITTNGTALAGSDYADASQTITFADGETLRSVQIPILDDARAEPPETVNLSLSPIAGQLTLGGTSSATLTIVDDEPRLQATGRTLKTATKRTFTGIIADFTSADFTTAASFAAVIYWGDGTQSAGSIVDGAEAGTFSVIGTHKYAKSGSYPVYTVITDANGSAVAAFSTIVCGAPKQRK